MDGGHKRNLREMAAFLRASELGGIKVEWLSTLEAISSASSAPAAEPFWHAVVSDAAPVINKAIRRADVAEEYAQKCRDEGYTVEVVPLFRAVDAAQPAPALRTERDIYLSESEAGTLRDAIGDGEPQALRLQIGDGHGGYGLYASASEYPEEGAVLVTPLATDAAQPAPATPQRFMVTSIKHKAGVVTLCTINAEDVLPPLESGQEVCLSRRAPDAAPAGKA